MSHIHFFKILALVGSLVGRYIKTLLVQTRQDKQNSTPPHTQQRQQKAKGSQSSLLPPRPLPAFPFPPSVRREGCSVKRHPMALSARLDVLSSGLPCMTPPPPALDTQPQHPVPPALLEVAAPRHVHLFPAVAWCMVDVRGPCCGARWMGVRMGQITPLHRERNPPPTD